MQSIKLRIVYDCSAKPNAQVPSLNDCLEMEPALQPQLFGIIVRNGMKVNCITSGVKKAFLQIWIQEEEHSTQRNLWYEDLKEGKVVTLLSNKSDIWCRTKSVYSWYYTA